MSPPTYGDLGKQARDVFGKGFNFGLIKLDVKTKTDAGPEFSSSGQFIPDTGKVTGSIETKHKLKEYGATFSSKWSTDSVLASKFAFEDALIKGLKVTMDTTYNANSQVKDGKICAELHQELVSLCADVDLNLSGPIVNAAAVIGKTGCSWLAGYQMSYDTAKSKLTKNNVGLGLNAKDFILHANINDGQIFGGSLYKKINPCCELGLTLGWVASTNTATFGAGAKYILDDTTCFRAKLSNNRQLGMGLQQKIRDGFNVTLSTLIDGKNLNQGGHKVGMAVELEA